MSNARRWKVSGSDADLLTQVEGDWISCDPDLDWTVVLASDYDALAARLAEREAEIAKNGRHAMRVTIAQIEARLAEAERALAEVGGPVAGIPWVVPGSWQSRHAKAIDAARAASSAERREADAL